MTISEKVAYLKGMMEGMELDTEKGNGKLLAKIVEILDDMEAFAEMLWSNLNPDNKISLFVRYTDIATGNFEQKIINKHV